MITINVPAQAIRAAQSCAAKQDVRYYLNGVYLSKSGQVVGTNGHTLYVADCDFELPGVALISIDGAIPKSAQDCKVHFIDENFILVECYNSKDALIKRLPATYSDMCSRNQNGYIDYSTVIPTTEPVPTAKIGINPKYLKLIEKIYPSNYHGVAIEMRGDSKPIIIKPSRTYGDGLQAEQLLIMPTRL